MVSHVVLRFQRFVKDEHLVSASKRFLSELRLGRILNNILSCQPLPRTPTVRPHLLSDVSVTSWSTYGIVELVLIMRCADIQSGKLRNSSTFDNAAR